MPPILHSAPALLSTYLAPLAALSIALAVALAARGKAWSAIAFPLALLIGWALLQPVTLLPRVLWAPHRGAETLLAPALAGVIGMGLLAWRLRARPRLMATAMALFAGRWIARDWVGVSDFWRVWFGIAALAALLSRMMQAKPDRVLVFAAALWGGLMVAGAGTVWTLAALVTAAGAAGAVAAGARGVFPSALLAALLGATDLAGGRLLRGRLDMVDVACVTAVVAPLAGEWLAARFGTLPKLVAPVMARSVGVAAAVGAVWLLRRAFFT